MHGRIDIHCHLVPGIDDGCRTVDEAVTCIRALIDHGYTASICTPHLWPEMFPANCPQNIQFWTEALAAELAVLSIDYTLYPGGELRLFQGAVQWMKNNGVPTLADSPYVLVDCWENAWPKHGDRTIDWLLSEDYIPILAHPERNNFGPDHAGVLDVLIQRGVLLQGNFNPFSGCDTPGSQQQVHENMHAGRYTFLAMDMHRPDTLGSRLQGLDDAIATYSQAAVDRLIAEHPRRMILGQESAAESGAPGARSER